MRAAVVGLGKIGLPLAVQLASHGASVSGCDVDPRVVDKVGRGIAPFPGEPGLDEKLARVVAAGLLNVTSDTSAAVAEVDVVIVVVPLVVDSGGRPIFDSIDAATRDIGRGLRAGHLVVYETTLPVGATRRRFGPILAETSGLDAGGDFHLAFSPERVSSGRVFEDLRAYPKLVGGIDDDSAKAAVSFYENVLEFDERADLSRPNGVWDLGSAESAELAKLAETTYRDVNIALANEFAEFAEDIGIDIGPVIEASNSQPFSHIHRPGLVGGHCIPVYPHFYLSGHPSARIPRIAREVNEEMASRIVRRVEERTGGLSGLNVTVLGATYRGGVKETAFSGVFPLAEAFEAAGATVRVHDPMLNDDELAALDLEPFVLGAACDIAVVQSDHDEYRKIGSDDLEDCRLVVDIRRVVDPERWDPETEIIVLGVGDHPPAGDNTTQS